MRQMPRPGTVLRSDDGMTVLTVAMSVTNEIELHTSSPDVMYDPE